MPSTRQFSLTVPADLARNKVCTGHLSVTESSSKFQSLILPMLLSTWTRALVWLLQPTAPMRTLLLAPLSEQPGRQLQLQSTVRSTWLWLL